MKKETIMTATATLSNQVAEGGDAAIVTFCHLESCRKKSIGYASFAHTYQSGC